jgi:hypothetical protein
VTYRGHAFSADRVALEFAAPRPDMPIHLAAGRPSRAALEGRRAQQIDLTLPRSRPATVRTDEGTIALLHRLAAHYPDGVIAGILNRQERATAYGHRFTAGRVGNLRRHWGIPCLTYCVFWRLTLTLSDATDAAADRKRMVVGHHPPCFA